MYRPTVSRVDKGGETDYRFVVTDRQDYTFAAAHYLHAARDIDGVTVGVYFFDGGQEKVARYIDKCAAILKFEDSLYEQISVRQLLSG